MLKAKITLSCALLLSSAAGGNTTVKDRQALLEGVRAIASPGVPGPICVFGSEAFVVATGGSGAAKEPLVAAARIGKGRAIVFGHNGFGSKESLAIHDTRKFLTNCIRWAAARGNRGVRVGILEDDEFHSELSKPETTPIKLQRPLPRLNQIDVLVANVHLLTSKTDRDRILHFVEAGGGVILGGLGWGWKQLNPSRQLLTEHPGNQLLASHGLAWADGTLEDTARDGFTTEASPPVVCHARFALMSLLDRTTGQRNSGSLELATAILTRAVRSIAPSHPFLKDELGSVRKDFRSRLDISEKKPVGRSDGLARVLLALDAVESRGQPPEFVRAHPCAADFPGVVSPTLPRIQRKTWVDLSIPRWHGTGLFANAGERIEIRVAPETTKLGLSIRIGSHKDKLWHKDPWKRFPEISQSNAIETTKTILSSAFGGLIYVEVPEPIASRARAESKRRVEVEIRGAVEAPTYVLGHTTMKAWTKSRQAPAPWGELATEKIILTVPSRVLRNLDDPTALLELWNRISDACRDLATLPHHRSYPERYVTDRQISAGYMHAGYPIMTHLDVAERLCDREALLSDATSGWGFFHEIGHNHQSPDWTFGGTGEVTVNLFTLYVLETVFGISTRDERNRSELVGEKRQTLIDEHLQNGASFESWKKNPFLALILYVELQEAFGWKAYKTVFREYKRLPNDKRPKNDAEKRDQWMVRFSRAVGKNLGPFFTSWGIPLSDDALRSVDKLPRWMPARARD